MHCRFTANKIKVRMSRKTKRRSLQHGSYLRAVERLGSVRKVFPTTRLDCSPSRLVLHELHLLPYRLVKFRIFKLSPPGSTTDRKHTSEVLPCCISAMRFLLSRLYSNMTELLPVTRYVNCRTGSKEHCVRSS